MVVRVASTVALLLLLLSLRFAAAIGHAAVLKIDDSHFRPFVFSRQARFLRLTSGATFKKLSEFNEHYALAAKSLQDYGIELAELSCDENPTFEPCARKNAELYLYGFKGAIKEKLVLPVDTLADENAIIASALHLELINKVPIIQSVTELNNLYEKCRDKCDVILSYHNTLGTKEHRLFLSLAWRLHSSGKLFALTTSALASPLKHKTNEARQQHVHMWQLQCRHHHCRASAFLQAYAQHQLDTFVAALNLPTWIRGKDLIKEDYMNYPQLLMIYDSVSKSRVMRVADGLATTFRGSVFVSIYSAEEFANISSVNLVPPSVIFIPHRNGSCLGVEEGIVQNGLEDVKKFVKEQIMTEAEQQMSQSDVVNSRFITRNSITGHTKINLNEEKLDFRLNSVCRADEVKMIDLKLYYVTWDELSNSMLKIFDKIEAKQEMLPVRMISRIDCLNDGDDCDQIDIYPTLEFTTEERTFRTYALSWKKIMSLLYTLGKEIKQFEKIEDLLEEIDKPMYKYSTSLGLIIDRLGTIPKRNLTDLSLEINAVTLRKDAAKYMEEKLGCLSPCFGIYKLDDSFEPLVKYSGEFLLHGADMERFVRERRHPILPELSSENFPRLRTKLLAIVLGLPIAEPIIESARRASALLPQWLAFSYIKKNASWYERVRRVHLPGGRDAGLVALNLEKGQSYLFTGNSGNETEIWRWIQEVRQESIEPTVVLPANIWRPEEDAPIDFSDLAEADAITDNEGLFVVPAAEPDLERRVKK
ncbi:Hypothetical predicted protein [Cloeon dipterum]|uniref:Thioredoxin domain-containing protein n=2 Tax=Cloeon dipterum TaxID=197152 RepID=A0A8S1DTK2_9INSE|nr:Hypothetical predicted protein [Cloeon dipterum]